ncbi:D-alanyl-D-alanine carboxypeptidase family protein [Paenibacillus pasadenensis]|uniref:D-alanyl-D-alanine carboxypeptidase family protein n=1 Tax=Paenibacillus pasadenensis TaxID=217090 RepID=UPI00203AB752|nr:D-alanyl-D-alanine carboxypeptidase family protein [Paenibacillus pasadenensis]MCM3749223.1 D-alanyl-D-alanine carboxypeptidase family protein [Paenibacillus pasadenensis]
MERQYCESRTDELNGREIHLSRADIHKGHLILINQTNGMKDSPASEELGALSQHAGIKQWSEGMQLEESCLRQFTALLKASGGIDEVVAVSAYRTQQEQEQIYAGSLAENGPEYTARYVALPGHSEHQSGLAIDVGALSGEMDFIAPSFPDSGACLAFKQLAASYGFIQRYKADKEAITGISCEPWHFRYVGYPHSAIMEQRSQCLEEYIESLEKHEQPNELIYRDEAAEFRIYYMPFGKGERMTVPVNCSGNFSVSGTNREGFVVTVKQGIEQVDHAE